MEIQQSSIHRVRASIFQQLGNKVLIQLDRGRHRIEYQQGVIQDAYPSVFTILVHYEKEENPPRLLSFSYADVLTKDVRMRLC